MSEKIMLSIDPANQQPQDVYKLLIGSILPRPIAFVSTVDKNNVRNLAPFSFFTVASSNPPVLAFCASVPANDRTTKDTLRNVIETREFVVNIVSEDFAEQMNHCSATVPPEVDEFELSGLTPIASEVIKPARVAESQVQMECRLLLAVTVSEKPMGGNLVLGEVLRFHVAEDLVSNFQIDPEKLRPIGRMGGEAYCRTSDRFKLKRPG